MRSRPNGEDDGKKEFRLVRIKNQEDFATGAADLGIFIARSPQAEVGCPCYYVAHILPDGIVKRCVQPLGNRACMNLPQSGPDFVYKLLHESGFSWINSRGSVSEVEYKLGAYTHARTTSIIPQNIKPSLPFMDDDDDVAAPLSLSCHAAPPPSRSSSLPSVAIAEAEEKKKLAFCLSRRRLLRKMGTSERERAWQRPNRRRAG